MRFLVVTTVHTPLDARIHRRQIGILTAMGHEVTYVAPWRSTGTSREDAGQHVRAIDVPRSVGRDRWTAISRARRLVARLADDHDLVIIHDPELLAIAPARRWRTPLVWDVHEDVATSLLDRSWVPPRFRRAIAGAVRLAESAAERHLHLVLAESAYRERFSRVHPVVPNVPWLPTLEPPAPDDGRVVYVGRISNSRGARQMLEIAHVLGPDVPVHLIGDVDADLRGEIELASQAGVIHWHGFLPNEQALEFIQGASVGLSLIEPQPNHRVSLQSKVLDYLSRRVPVLVSDLPVTGPFVRERDVGRVVPYGDVDAAVMEIRRLIADGDERRQLADRGFALVQAGLCWDVEGPRFEQILRGWAVS